MLAYLVQYKSDLKTDLAVYAARTRNQVKLGLYRSRREHWMDTAYTQILARRVPQFDGQARSLRDLRGPVCIGWREAGECWGVGGEKLIGIDTED